ncbi:hypothetical protein [Natranaerobius thermophilus]|uniref:Uncharacterized protein n=1 Tax=Natranaerobius thermophilus (strain ATCC BAA-1301 / DSM 18059 / JW/NM-WN-LF) TaxID=457570 RepID=B2A1M3_NATTJ|nr:hypothetical protein [Natranaerobius thermophilus]ACB84778.1 hypothetical protein Nther_1195 [Natranaerobius thermophilus JW/NM-WN-LF]
METIIIIIIILVISAIRNAASPGHRPRRDFPKPTDEQEIPHSQPKRESEQEGGFPEIPTPEELPGIPGFEDQDKDKEKEIRPREISSHAEDVEMYKEDGRFIDEKLKNYRTKKQKKSQKHSKKVENLYRVNKYRSSSKSADVSSLLDSRNDLKKAILLTEILGPPKSKRPH